jgi:hypothetical protein
VPRLLDVALVLRNLSALKTATRDALFLKYQMVQRLLLVLSKFQDVPALALNVVRVLSKLSLSQPCADLLAGDQKALRAFLELLSLYNGKLQLCVRLCFILGNLTVTRDEVRELLGQHGAVATLAATLQMSVERFSKLEKLKRIHSKQDIGSEKDQSRRVLVAREVGDLLVKVIRLIANLAINPALGAAFVRRPEIASLVHLLKFKSAHADEELLLNTTSCLTNLSFYFSPELMPTPDSAASEESADHADPALSAGASSSSNAGAVDSEAGGGSARDSRSPDSGGGGGGGFAKCALLGAYKEILAHLLPLLFEVREGSTELLVEVCV